MKQVVHILRYFGHPNQSYTTKILETLNQDSKQLMHIVLCDSVLAQSKKISVIKTNSYRQIYFNINSCFLAFYEALFNVLFKELTKGFSFKKRFKLAIKWQPLWKLKPEVIHIHHLQVVDLWLLQYIKSKNIKCMVSLRGMELMRDTLTKENQTLFLEKMACIDKVHVISQFMFDYALEKLIPKHKLIKVYRGFDKEFILSENLKTATYKEGELIKIIAVGRLAWEKGQDQLLESIARLKQKGHQISLDIYGEGPLEAYLKFRTFQLELTKEVCFLGQIPNEALKKKYKNYNVAVQPSLFEALSNGLLDLTIHNLPCVIPQVGGMPEIITHGKNGIVYNPDNPEALDKAILDALHLDLQNLKQVNKNLYEIFSIEKELQGLEEMYLSNS